MPCFKGLAVSIHTPDGPLPEHSVQRHSRASRIASYIPVPPPKIPDQATGKAEQSTFAISITLLTPGLHVPYSTPKPTADTPHPKAKVVSGAPTGGSIGPYQPLTASPNETIAAYIYFDGRQKEEVATLLRRGEETWVNSRWVGVPESEGGGLAEREFLFREVGLERWLNGLDLEGGDAAQKIERRRQKMERRRRKREAASRAGGAGDADMEMDGERKSDRQRDVLRYGNNSQSPVEDLSEDEDLSSDSDPEDDDDPVPETAGQIKVALFRVLASGEVRRGEYAPQFDAHDDDDEQGAGGEQNGGGKSSEDVDHTTSFAKPKTLDPKSISTQTVTGIDPTDRPYAIFTFMYRGERQLQKMGILKTSKPQEKELSTPAKRKSGPPDFANLGPLKPGGTVGFMNFRDNQKPNKASKKKANGSDAESDDEDDDATKSIVGKSEEDEEKDIKSHLSPDDVKQQGELAESLRQVKLKRQHSAEPLSAMGGSTERTSQSNTPTTASTPPAARHGTSTPPTGSESVKQESSLDGLDKDALIGSPLKKQRASVSNVDDDDLRRRMGGRISAGIQEIMASPPESNSGLSQAPGGSIPSDASPETKANSTIKVENVDEEEL